MKTYFNGEELKGVAIHGKVVQGMAKSGNVFYRRLSYKRVNALIGTGYSMIDTGVPMTSDLGISAVFSVDNLRNANGFIGVYEVNKRRAVIRPNNGNIYFTFGRAVATGTPLERLKKYYAFLGKREGYLSETIDHFEYRDRATNEAQGQYFPLAIPYENNVETEPFTTNKNITLFATASSFVNGDAFTGRMYEAVIYNARDKEEILRHFVPMLRSDGVAGMMDLVEQKFYPSVTDTPFGYEENIN